MKIKVLFCLPLFLLSILFANSQISENVSLFGTLNPEPIRYSGCFGYTDAAGNEYALLGGHDHLFVINIDDSTNIYVIDSVAGPGSNWREITVIDSLAFVVTEGSGTGEGMQVIDLSYLPDSVHLITTYDSTFSRVHMIQKNFETDSIYVYAVGTTPSQGVHIIDISDPTHPVEISRYEPYYIHDVHVRGNRMYASAIFEGVLDIVDISDRTNPVLLNKLIYPNAFTHSSFTSEDHTHLMVTDETDGLPARIWNIEDINNVMEVSQYTGNDSSLVHNPYIKGDFAFVSHNAAGLRVIDITKPDVPVEVGYYDTYSGISSGFHGLWSSFPFFPSNKIIGGNREDGLYIFKFNNTYAGRFYGLVIDSLTGTPIIGADISIVGTTSTTKSDITGSFKFGELPSGPTGYSLNASASGYAPKSISNQILNSNDSIYIIIELNSFVGINDVIQQSNIFIAYDELLNEVNINLENQQKGNFHFELFTPEGKLCLKVVNLDNKIHRLKVDNLNKGIYLYRVIESTNNLFFSNKLIIE